MRSEETRKSERDDLQNGAQERRATQNRARAAKAEQENEQRARFVLK